jgi:hypothetical protein
MKLSALALALAAVSGDVHITRTITNVEAGFFGAVNLAAGCSATDAYGCSDIRLAWGSDTIASINRTIPRDLGAAARMKGKIKVTAALVPVNVEIDCPLCGGTAAAPASCSIKLPLGLKPTKLHLKPCPMTAETAQVTVKNVSLPHKSPLGIVSAKLSGSVTITDDAGATVVTVAVSGKIDK